MTAEPATASCTTRSRAYLGRVACGVAVALALGVGFSALGASLVGDFTSFSEPPSEKTYLVTLPDDESLLRDLSQQMMSTHSSEAGSLNSIAPAAGSPLGTLGE